MSPFNGRNVYSRPVFLQDISDVRPQSHPPSPSERQRALLSPNVTNSIAALHGQNKRLSRKDAMKNIKEEMARLDIFTVQRGIILREVSNSAILRTLQGDELDKICRLVMRHSTPAICSTKPGESAVLRKKTAPPQLQGLVSTTARELVSKEDRIAVVTNVIDYLGTFPKLTDSNYKHLKSVLVENIRVMDKQLSDHEKAPLRNAFWNAMSSPFQGVPYDPRISNLQHHDDKSLISEMGKAGAVLALGFNWLGTNKEPSPKSDGPAGNGQRYRHPDLRKYTLEKNDEVAYVDNFLQKEATQTPVKEAMAKYGELKKAEEKYGETSSLAYLRSQELSGLIQKMGDQEFGSYERATKIVDWQLASERAGRAERAAQERQNANMNSKEIADLTQSLASQYAEYKKASTLYGWNNSLALQLRKELQGIQEEMEGRVPGAFSKAMRQIEGVEEASAEQTPVPGNKVSTSVDWQIPHPGLPELP